jgi:ribosome-binding ATPase YchF (GTP1/OBG family)
MKVCAYGLSGIHPGKHNVKDPRLDQADKLVEAKKKVYAQVDVAGAEEALKSDAIVTSVESRLELVLQDLEFVEARLSHAPSPAETEVLQKMKAGLESEKFISALGLTAADWQVTEAHAFLTAKPVVVGTAAELAAFDEFLVRVLAESGIICFLTVGGIENRAWPIKQGLTAPEAAATIHTDLLKSFIRAEVISWADFVAGGGEKGAKHAGKLRLESRAYVMQDYDVVNFRVNK